MARAGWVDVEEAVAEEPMRAEDRHGLAGPLDLTKQQSRRQFVVPVAVQPKLVHRKPVQPKVVQPGLVESKLVITVKSGTTKILKLLRLVPESCCTYYLNSNCERGRSS